MKRLAGALLIIALLVPCTARAHHGGVTLAFGPGSPIETNSPLTLPEGGLAVSSRLEQVEWQRFHFADPANKTSFTFSNIALSYGIKPYLTGSVFIPYFIKRQEDGSNDGLADVKFQANLGFNYDPVRGFMLNEADDTAITLESSRKPYFSIFGGITAPTGRSHMKIGGEIDRTMQPGFRSPSFTVGASATRMINNRFSLVGDISCDIFTESDDFKFGNEFRANLAGVHELYAKAGAFISRIDAIFELNLLNISRDEEFGIGQRASGGTILYVTPGVRFSFPKLWNANLGLGVKLPTWKDLNEKGEQQGAEGLEEYRTIATLSFFF